MLNDVQIVCKEECGKWFYIYNDVEGKKRKRVCRGCSTKQEAELYVSKLKFCDKKQYLIKVIAADMFLPNSKHMCRTVQFGKTLTEKTRKQKRAYIEEIIREFGNQFITNLNICEVQSKLINDSRSSSWKNHYLETFSAIYDETVWKCTKPVPRPKMRRFVNRYHKADIFTTEELAKFLCVENFSEFRDYVIFYVIASCGLRLGEARGLRVSQFLFNQKVLVIDGFCRVNGERTSFNKSGCDTNTKIRMVPLSDELIAMVRRYIRSMNIVDGYVFRQRNGNVLRQEYLERIFKRACCAANIETKGRKLVPHSLRYTYITRMRRFASVDLVRQLAGHSSSQMTEYYTRFGVEEMFYKVEDARSALEKLFI